MTPILAALIGTAALSSFEGSPSVWKTPPKPRKPKAVRRKRKAARDARKKNRTK